MYCKVLKTPDPITPRKISIFGLSRTSGQSRLRCAAASGRINKLAPVQRKAASVSGGTKALAHRPMTKFPAQHSMVTTSST